MLILCDKCNKTTDAKLRKETELVICSDCGQQIENVTSFIVNAMRSSREFIEEKKQSFSFPCKPCAMRTSGLVTLDGKQVICTECGGELGVSPFMRLTMKNLGLYVPRVVETEEE